MRELESPFGEISTTDSVPTDTFGIDTQIVLSCRRVATLIQLADCHWLFLSSALISNNLKSQVSHFSNALTLLLACCLYASSLTDRHMKYGRGSQSFCPRSPACLALLSPLIAATTTCLTVPHMLHLCFSLSKTSSF